MGKKSTYYIFIVLDFCRPDGSTLPLPSCEEIQRCFEEEILLYVSELPKSTLYDAAVVTPRDTPNAWCIEQEIQGLNLRQAQRLARFVADELRELGNLVPQWRNEAIPHVLVSA